MAPQGPPAQKADPKAKAKAEAKPKAKPKAKEEVEVPKLPAPDRAAFEEKVQLKNGEVDALQQKLKVLSGKIGERSTGKDEFFAQKTAIRAKLDEASGHMNNLQGAKDELQKGLAEKREEAKNMRQEVNKAKKSLGFTSEEQIDDRIATLEFKLWTDTVSLKEEKKVMEEIKELKRNKPKVAGIKNMESNLGGVDPSMSIKEKVGAVNEQMAVHREAKKAAQAEYSALMEERTKQMGNMPELFEEREALNKQVQEKIKERNVLRDEFRSQEREYNAHLAEQRAARQERAMADRKVRDAERDQERRQRAADKLEERPFVSEMTLIEQTIFFCKNLLPKDEQAKAAVEKKAIAHTNKGEEVVLVRKEDAEEEFYFAPTKGKAAKKKAGGGAKPKAANIKHNVETFRLFESLKLDAPITTDDVPALLTKLEAQLEEYEAKVKVWEENRDEMKRKILEGILPEDEEKKEEEEEKKDEEKKEDA